MAFRVLGHQRLDLPDDTQALKFHLGVIFLRPAYATQNTRQVVIFVQNSAGGVMCTRALVPQRPDG